MTSITPTGNIRKNQEKPEPYILQDERIIRQIERLIDEQSIVVDLDLRLNEEVS